jgi:hypothetical protein
VSLPTGVHHSQVVSSVCGLSAFCVSNMREKKKKKKAPYESRDFIFHMNFYLLLQFGIQTGGHFVVAHVFGCLIKREKEKKKKTTEEEMCE